MSAASTTPDGLCPLDAPIEPSAKITPPPTLDRPRRTPEELADLVTRLPPQEQAELTYDLVLYAARAVAEGEIGALAGFLAAIEDIAAVNTDLNRRFALEDEVEESAAAQPPLSDLLSDTEDHA
jgi:hypothetical protein